MLAKIFKLSNLGKHSFNLFVQLFYIISVHIYKLKIKKQIFKNVL